MISGNRYAFIALFTSVIILSTELDISASIPNSNTNMLVSRLVVFETLFIKSNLPVCFQPIADKVGFNLHHIIQPINSIIMANAGIGINDITILDRVISYYQESDMIVRILLIILGVLLSILVALFFIILINRHIKTKKRGEIDRLRQQYQDQLAVYLFDEDAGQFEFNDIHDPFYRQIFIDVIHDLHANFHGETAEKLRNLYFNLDLHKDSLSKIKNRNWHIKGKGFRELAQMDVKEATPLIQKFINVKNPILRIDAQVAMVKLSGQNPLDFLEKINYELSYWEQINIYNTLVYHQINVDSFEPLLSNPNSSVVAFAVRMIGLFKHVQSADKVKTLLDDDCPDVRLAAVKTIGAFENPIYADALKTLFLKETEIISVLKADKEKPKKANCPQLLSLDDLAHRKIRHAILEVMHATASNEDIPFLKAIALDAENSIRIRTNALAILNTLPTEGKAILDKLRANGDEQLIRIINVITENQ